MRNDGMRRDADLDRAIEELMDDGPEVLPEVALQDALDRVEATRQRPMALVRSRVLRSSVGDAGAPWWSTLAAVAAVLLLVAILVAELGGQRVGVEATPSPEPTPSASAALVAPTVQIEPQSIIPVPGAYLTATDGESTVWASGDEELVRIDAATQETSSIPVPIPEGSWAGLVVADGDVWAGNYDEGVVYRIDPDSGEIEAEIEVGPEAVSLTAVPEGVWVRTVGGVTWEAHRIDPATNEVAATVDGGNAISAGHGSVWFSQRGADRLIRADPLSGEPTAVIEVPREHDCSVVSTEDAAWGSCLLIDRVVGTIARIDPDSDEHVATINIGGGASWVFDAGGTPWVAVTSPDGGYFAAIDLERNVVSRILMVGPGFDPDNVVIAGDSAWVANDSRSEVYRFPLSVFEP